MTTLLSCQKPVNSIDPLEEIGLLGKWLRDTTYINGLVVSTTSADSLEFLTGFSSADFVGTYIASHPGYNATGAFSVDTVNETIKYGESDTTTRSFEVEAGRLIFRFVVGPKDYVDCRGRVE